MYVVLAVPIVEVEREDVIGITWTRSIFIQLTFEYGFIWSVFAWIIGRFIARNLNYKLDNIPIYISSQKVFGKDKNVLAYLFRCNQMTKNNVVYRSHLYFTSQIMYFLCVVPHVLVIGWGFTLISQCSPTALGFGVVFFGSAAHNFWYGLRNWQFGNWRMTNESVFHLELSFFLFLFGLVTVVMSDPAIAAGQNVDFTALSLLFGTFECIPLLFFVFRQDKFYKYQINRLIKLLTEADEAQEKMKDVDSDSDENESLDKPPLKTQGKGQKEGQGDLQTSGDDKGQPQHHGGNPINRGIHDLLEENYTLNPNCELFKFSTVLSEIKDIHGQHHGAEKTFWQRRDPVYMTAAFIRLIYFFFILAVTNHASMGFMNCCTLTFLDLVHTLLSWGDNHWTPGFKIALLVVGRLIIMSSGVETWIMSYSACYAIYGLALISATVDQFLPIPRKEVLESAALTGKEIMEEEEAKSKDISTTPGFLLGLLTFAFIFVIAVDSNSYSAGSPTIDIEILGSFWPIHVFGMLAAVAIVTGVFFMTGIRAFRMQQTQILGENLGKMYFLKTSIELPSALFIFGVVFALALGCLVVLATGSAFLLVSFVFVPPIIACFGHAYRVWLENDYDLVIWPRKEKISKDFSINMRRIIKERTAYVEKKEEVQVIEDTGERTVNLMKVDLPEMSITGDKVETTEAISMPKLPVKSALRAKRNRMGIGTNNLLTGQSRQREGGDKEKFGDGDEEVLDINDPWAKYRDYQTEEERIYAERHRGPKTGLATTTYEESIFDHEYYQNARYVVVTVGTYLYTNGGKVFSDMKKTAFTLVDTAIAYIGGSDVADASAEDASDDDFYAAIFSNKLNHDEKMAIGSWVGGLLLVMLYGITLGETVSPHWLGPVMWYSVWMFLFTAIPIYKYFNTYRIDSTIKNFIVLCFVMHITFSFAFFFGELEMDVGLPASMWILDYFLYYPLLVFMIIEFYGWKDGGWKMDVLDKDGDGNITYLEYAMFLKAYPLAFFMAIVFNFQIYVWVSSTAGILLTLFLLVGGVVYFFVRDWASNDFYVSPEVVQVGKYLIYLTLFVTGIVVLSADENPIFTITIFCVTMEIVYAIQVAKIMMIRDPESVLFISPAVMPIFSFTPQNDDIIDETELSIAYLNMILLATIWGALVAIFVYPVYVGILASCTCMLILASIVVGAVTFIPLHVMQYLDMMTHESLVLAANAARERFAARRIPFSLEITGWKTEDDENKPKPAPKQASEEEKLKLLPAITLADMLIKHNQTFRYAPRPVIQFTEEKVDVAEIIMKTGGNASSGRAKNKTTRNRQNNRFRGHKQNKIVDEETKMAIEDVEDPSEQEGEDVPAAIADGDKIIKPVVWYKRYYRFVKSKAKAIWTKICEYLPTLPTDCPPEWKQHSQATYSFSDALADALISGRGWYGIIGLQGYMYKFIVYAEEQPRLKWLRQSWLLDAYDEVGNYMRAIPILEKVDLVSKYNRVRQLDTAINHTFKEEYRCGAHFVLMMIVGAKSKLSREKMFLQKFMREHRVQLESEDISIPGHIYGTSSFSSVNVSDVSVWLHGLQMRPRIRFHSLKKKFVELMHKRDEEIDDDDYGRSFEADSLLRKRAARDRELIDSVRTDILRRKELRIDKWAATLIRADAMKFAQKRPLWTSGKDVYVDSLDVDLYDKYRASLERAADEITDYAWECLNELENHERDCAKGAFGRHFQFVDPDFPPYETSIGEADSEHHEHVLGWRCAPGINYGAKLIDDGTDADDVRVGYFKNTWLMSAIMMLASAGAEGEIKQEVMKCFIARLPPKMDDVQPPLTYESSVGAYCLRIFKDGQWLPLLLDDLFPILKSEHHTEANAGVACAYSDGFAELWVPLVEKAFAKYLGSYDALREGYVHHALNALTGADSECLFISGMARGVGKLAFWDMLTRYHQNRFILGAGTGTAEMTDSEILDMGIVFEQAYVIMDVRTCDGLKLMKLRNPPGDHDEWKGDWSDNSALWTKRLKAKLGWVDADDNTFWMAFDDFTNIFRYLYLAKWFDPKKWLKQSIAGEWKMSSELEEEQKKALREMMSTIEETPEDKIEEDRRMAKASVITSGGMPTRHNPDCVVQNNPHYSLRILRPTELKIELSQVDSRGIPRGDPLPAAIFVCRCSEPNSPGRLETLDKDNILASSGEARAVRNQYLYTFLQPGSYVVLVPIYVAGMTGQFDLSIFSNFRVDFNALWPPKWMLKGGREVAADTDAGSSIFNTHDAAASIKKKGSNFGKDMRKGLVSLFGTGNIQEVAPSSSDSDND
jgi:hypothetical protein